MRNIVRNLQESRIREVANAGIGRSDVLPFWFGESDEVTPDGGATDDGGDTPLEAQAGAGGGRAAARATRAGVHSREDAVRAIDEIITYFRDSEPTSPVPLLLGRAKRWVSMDFLAILEDFSPDAAREAEKLRGTPPE